MVNKIKPKCIELNVQYLVSTKADDHYVTDEDGDYDTERLVGGSWTTYLLTETIELTDVKQVDAIFDAEDGDYDFSKNLQLITDKKDRVWYNPRPDYNETKEEYDGKRNHFIKRLKEDVQTIMEGEN